MKTNSRKAKKSLSWFLMVALVAAGAWLWSIGQKTDRAVYEDSSEEWAAKEVEVRPEDRAAGEAGESPRPEKSESLPRKGPLDRQQIRDKRVTEMMPTQEVLRQEVADNPHGTPPSLLRFASELGRRMEEVTGRANGEMSHQRAGQLLQELDACVTSADGTSSVQALCLTNAKRLARSYPDMQQEYNEIESRASEPALRVFRSLGRLSGG